MRFLRPAAIALDQISGLQSVMDDAVRFKLMTAPLTAEQLSQVAVPDQLKWGLDPVRLDRGRVEQLLGRQQPRR